MTEFWAMITGASRGFGVVLAQEFWKAGYNLHLIARDTEAMIRLQHSLMISSSSQQCLIHELDLSSISNVDSFCEEIQSQHWPVHVLINNAAMHGPLGPLVQSDLEDWRTTFQVDLFAAVALCQAVIPGMINHHQGSIINISGGGATGPRPFFNAYASAKTALVRYSETLAAEVREYNIRVNCIAPGPMPTKLLEEVLHFPSFLSSKELDQAQKSFQSDKHSMIEAAELALFLSDSNRPFLSGKIISALWDDWRNWQDNAKLIDQSDIYTLRRIVAKDRELTWLEK